MPGFGDIRFGFADAHKEGTEAPDLLLHGFLDDAQMTQRALRDGSFLFLGYKGSGKTAIAERARLLAREDPELFVTTVTLDEFSYGDFKAFAGTTGDFQTRYPAAWAWSLLLFLVQSLERDEGGRANAPPEYAGVVRGLQELDLLPLPQLKVLVTRSSKRGFKASIPKFFEFTDERVSEGQDLQLLQMAGILRRAVSHFPTHSRHVLFVDGLDDVLTQRELQFQAIAALISEVTRLNSAFREADKPFKIVVLCRTDIFDRLPGANKNKVRQDSAETLDWYDDPRDPDRTRLVRLVNLRAARSLDREVSVFDEFLPPQVDQRPTRRHLLERTRHVPRDVLQLMKSLQKFGDGGRLTENQVKSGVRDYSIGYFLPELRDELHGYLEPAQIDHAIMLLTSLGSDGFTLAELDAQAARLGLASIDIPQLIHTLFECSGVGMIDRVAGRPLFTFKYRNPTAVPIPGRRMIIHPGAHKALNIERRGRRDK
jgi:hypothetical protein